MKIHKTKIEMKDKDGNVILDENNVPIIQDCEWLEWEAADITKRHSFKKESTKTRDEQLADEIKNFYPIQSDADILAFWLEMKLEIIELKKIVSQQQETIDQLLKIKTE